MLGKYYNPNSDFVQPLHKTPNSSPYSYWEGKRLAEQDKKVFKKKLYGQHYNYSLVGLNKQKKYMLEEQRNTQIQRANRILFEKIQKIGLRATNAYKNKRHNTQKVTEISQIHRKESQFDNFNEINSTYSPLQHLKKKSTQLNAKLHELSRTNPLKSKLIFQGYKEIDGKLLFMTIRFDKNMFLIQSQHGNVQHKIQMELRDYRVLFREALKGDHLNIFALLRFNGTILELMGGRTQQVNIVEHEELLLPSVNQLFEPKNRAYTS